ncbi:MAG: OmpA family protein [Syntrophaceae bacterium]|nr:OmpA family protein [Syntrophaceae bacterium]
MKKITVFLVYFFLMASFSTVHAENKEGAFSLTPFWGVSFFENNQSIHKNSNWGTYGLRGGYNFTKNFSVEGFLSYTQVELETPVWYNYPWQDIYRYGIGGLYHFMPDGRFVPYVALGLGGIYYSKGLNAYNDPEFYEKYESNRFAVDYGAGLKIFLTENIALQTDIRHALSLNSRQDNPHHIHNDLLISFGMNFNFGGGKKEGPPTPPKIEAAPVPVDKSVDFDGDGVPDYLDKCPHTPKGMVVDKDGCLPDSDGDGVLDYEDHCPNTPADIPVDKDGCPSDSDFDGVSDYKDKCPRTPHGTLVGEDGCPIVSKKTSMLLKIEFDSNKAVIKKKYHKELKRVADFLKKNPKATATIVGHTDSTGNRQANIRLSRDRANSVREYLINNFGIRGSRVKAMGYGPDRPVASNKTKEGRMKNRRVVASFEVPGTK